MQPEDSDKLDQQSSKKDHQGGQLTDEDFGDDEVERITGGEPENEKTSNSEQQVHSPPEDADAQQQPPNVDSAGETVYSDQYAPE